MALKVEHEYKDENTDIPLVKCFVTARYYNGVWTYYKDSIDFITYVNKIGEHFNCKKCVF